jgi:hypothetical protein
MSLENLGNKIRQMAAELITSGKWSSPSSNSHDRPQQAIEDFASSNALLKHSFVNKRECGIGVGEK